MDKSKEKECCNSHQIIADFYDKILGYVITKVNNEDTAKDITQEVMGRLIDAYNSDKEISNVRAWLFQVSRNIIADRYRKGDLLEFGDSDDDLHEENDDFQLSAEDFIIPMINLLPDEYRTPLYMSDIENLKQSDIAKRLNLSLSATKMRCQRGRKKLQELFFECCDIQYTENGSFAHCTLKTTCTPLLEEEKKLKKEK